VVRSTSRADTVDSSCRNCTLSADGVRFTCSAARASAPLSAMDTKLCSQDGSM